MTDKIASRITMSILRIFIGVIVTLALIFIALKITYNHYLYFSSPEQMSLLHASSVEAFVLTYKSEPAKGISTLTEKQKKIFQLVAKTEKSFLRLS